MKSKAKNVKKVAAKKKTSTKTKDRKSEKLLAVSENEEEVAVCEDNQQFEQVEVNEMSEPTAQAFVSSENEERNFNSNSYRNEEYEDSLESLATSQVQEDFTISVKLSKSLFHKLKRTANEEGIDLNSFASELLSEGVVLRAWEIVEGKNALRGGNQNNSHSMQNGNNYNSGNNRNNNNNNRNNRNNRHRGRGGNPNWMDDKAQFLEYVRNQEKRQR